MPQRVVNDTATVVFAPQQALGSIVVLRLAFRETQDRWRDVQLAVALINNGEITDSSDNWVVRSSSYGDVPDGRMIRSLPVPLTAEPFTPLRPFVETDRRRVYGKQWSPSIAMSEK